MAKCCQKGKSGTMGCCKKAEGGTISRPNDG